jgi:hypothetical protein
MRRRDDMRRLFLLLDGNALSHPNKLEYEGNKAFQKAWRARAAGAEQEEGPAGEPRASQAGGSPDEELRACVSQRAVVVVTVNRVQAVFCNPVYECGSEGSLLQLDRYLSQACALDEQAYLSSNTASVHVPHVYLRTVPEPSRTPTQRPRVSVVLPVHNAEAFLAQALESVRQQDLCDWECICVDDASTDSSAEILCAAAIADPRLRLCTRAPFCTLTPHTYRSFLLRYVSLS